jgi:hypothetical protein
METAGACFERCLGQAPAEVLMLRQLEAATGWIVAQSQMGPWFGQFRLGLSPAGHGFKPQFKSAAFTPRLKRVFLAIP